MLGIGKLSAGPQNEGGLGIRRLKDINTPSRIILVWRLCTSDSLRAKWIFEHYLGLSALFSPTILQPGTWKWISCLKVQALSHMKRQLGNCSTTSLFFASRLKHNTDILIHHLSGYHISSDELNYQIL